MDNTELQKKSLKIQAFREKISELVVQYEDRIADLRVELTLAQNLVSELQTEIGVLRDSLESHNDVSETQEDTNEA